MNEYYVKYFDKGIMKTMRNIKSKEDAEKLAESLDSEFETVVGWEELETEELTPFPYKDPQQNIYGKVKVEKIEQLHFIYQKIILLWLNVDAFMEI